jgi:hypothetical protein
VPDRRSTSSDPRKVIDDMHTFATGQTQRLLGEPTLGIDNHMVGARLLGRGDLFLRRDAPDDMTAPQLDDLGQQPNGPP